MAVEIPVVIDIDKAFKEAAKKVGVAMMPLEKQIEKLTSDLAAWREILNQSDIKGDDWLVAAKNIQAISEQIAVADYELRRYTSNEGSIRRMNTDLAEMTRRWEAMGSAQKFNKDGSLSDDAKKLVANYKEVAAQVEKTGRSLQQIVAEEQRLNNLKQKGIQTRKYENAVLNSTVKTVRILQEQERILSDRLSRAQIGSSKYTALKQQLRDVRKELAGLDEAPGKIDATTAAIKRQTSAWAQVKSMATMYLSMLGGVRFMQNVRNVTAELEMQRIALGSIIQDTEKANSLFSQIKAAALKSPFEIKDLVTYTKQLSAYRIETDKLFDVTMKLADVSAGLGVDMNRLILAYGQVRAASVLRGQELRQFTEAGIPLVEKLAEKFSKLRGDMVSTSEVFELISKRAVPFRMIEEIFDDMTSAGGTFYEMQEKQSETLKGQWMKLKDAVTIMYDEIGNTGSVNAAMKATISLLNTMARNWQTIAAAIGAATAGLAANAVVTRNAMLAAKAKNAVDAAGQLILTKDIVLQRKYAMAQMTAVKSIMSKGAALKFETWWTAAYTRAEYAAATSTNVFTAAVNRLKLALLKNPFTALAVAIAAVIAGIVSLIVHLGKAKITLDQFDKALQDYTKAIDKFNQIEKALATFDALSKKENRTAEETQRLAKLTKDLAEAYPGAIKGAKELNGVLDVSIEAIRAAASSTKTNIADLLSKQVKAAKEEVGNIDKKIRALNWDIEHAGDLAPQYGVSPEEYQEGKQLFTSEEVTKKQEELLDLVVKRAEWTERIVSSEKMLLGLTGQESSRFDEGTWRKRLSEYKTTIKELDRVAYTEDEIENMSSLSNALDDVAQKYKQYNKEAEQYQKALLSASSEYKADIEKQKDESTKLRDMYAQILTDYDAWDLVSAKSGKELQNQIQEITNAYKKFIELRKREGTKAALADVDTLFPDLAGWEPTYDNVIQRLERMLTLYKGDADMTKLIKQALVNVKFDELKRVMDDTLKRLADDIKRSETARNFYNDILELTGDRDLAASMSIEIYGETGEQIKEKIQEQLRQAFVIDDAMVDADNLKLTEVKDAIAKAITEENTVALRHYMKYVVEDNKKDVKEIISSWEKASQQRMKTWITELAKTKSYAEKRVEIELKTAQRLREIEEYNLPDSQKKSLRAQYNEKKAKDLAKIEYEAFKDSPLYTEMFADLDAVSTQTLERMRSELIRLQSVWKDLDPTQLKEIQSMLEAIDKVAAERNPFGNLAKSFKDLVNAGFGKSAQLDQEAAVAAERLTQAKESQAYALEVYTKAQQKYNKVLLRSKPDSPEAKAAKERLDAAKMQLDVQTRALKLAQENADEAEKQKKAYADILRAIANTVEGLKKFNEKMQTAVAGAVSLMEALGASEESIGMILTMASGLDSVTSGIAVFASGFSNIISGKDIFGGITSLVGGIGGLFKGITDIFYAGRVKRANKEIKKQEKILISLQEAYKDLDRAIAKAFGNEYIYNYNQQLKNLQAQAAAYQKQAAAERSKGKKKDKSKIESYEQSYRDTLNEIKDMQYQMAEYFAGTDITSAAEAFADAWLEAYKEFGNTTDAIKEKMQDMVESIVKRAALAGVVQAVLQPWYNELAQIEQWDPGTVAAMINKAYELVPTITAGLGSEAAALQAAGVNLRDTVGDFKGISRDIAGASEESILALAAGINTQNFYMSYMPIINENVAAIRAALTGEAVGAQAPSLVQSNNDLVLQYMSVLPNMDANIAELLAIARKVVEPRGTNSSSHVVAVRM